MSDYQDRVEKRIPPSNVTFGEQVALIPAVPANFEVPLWKQRISDGKFANLYSSARVGYWINQGDEICGFGIFKHDPKCNWCLMIGIGKHGGVVTSIYSPLSGLVIGAAEDCFGEHPNMKTQDDEEVGKVMLAVLLPNNAVITETADRAFAEFCDQCSRYRQSIFFNKELQVTESKDGEFHSRDIWSNDKIDDALYNLRKRKIVVRPLSSLPYNEDVEELKRTYPANFR